ncbi:hypothetical protein OMR07_27880, partial [Methylobacterium organophilum]|nr:hypothetical protein [Methylobacterium organophilum]
MNRDALEELTAVIGTEKLVRILDRFVVSLTTAFEGPDRANDDYGREGHVDVVVDALGDRDPADPLGDAREQGEVIEFLEGVPVRE